MRVLSIALLALQLSAAPVLVTERGKTFHTARTCLSLKRSTQVYSVEESAARQHGLKPCGICYRDKAPKKSGPTWMKKEGK